MSKAVLVLDMPETCLECDFYYNDLDDNDMPISRCSALKCKEIDEFENKYSDCPLRELPEKAYHEYYCDNGRYDKGWNECLNAITGEYKPTIAKNATTEQEG